MAEMITYKAPGIEIKMEKEIAKEFVDRLLDQHLFSNPIEDWLFAWGIELELLNDDNTKDYI